jgi:hypothetical protein
MPKAANIKADKPLVLVAPQMGYGDARWKLRKPDVVDSGLNASTDEIPQNLN